MHELWRILATRQKRTSKKVEMDLGDAEYIGTKQPALRTGTGMRNHAAGQASPQQPDCIPPRAAACARRYGGVTVEEQFGLHANATASLRQFAGIGCDPGSLS